jgi:hypothetical protein
MAQYLALRIGQDHPFLFHAPHDPLHVLPVVNGSLDTPPVVTGKTFFVDEVLGGLPRRHAENLLPAHPEGRRNGQQQKQDRMPPKKSNHHSLT